MGLRKTSLIKYLRSISVFRKGGPSRARIESNQWLRERCTNLEGHVISIGSGNDSDGQGNLYRNYFTHASSYTTSEVSGEYACDLILDIRSMPEIKNESYDCIYCSGVLEHVDDYQSGINEITRILRVDGVLLLGLPFRQALHLIPYDYWRFTEYGIRHMLQNSYNIIDIDPIDNSVEGFPAAYWVMARKLDIY